MVCCGISSDFIYQRLKSAENEDSEKGNQLIYDLLFHDELKEPKTEEENKGGADGR